MLLRWRSPPPNSADIRGPPGSTRSDRVLKPASHLERDATGRQTGCLHLSLDLHACSSAGYWFEVSLELRTVNVAPGGSSSKPPGTIRTLLGTVALSTSREAYLKHSKTHGLGQNEHAYNRHGVQSCENQPTTQHAGLLRRQTNQDSEWA